jgi:hypothetical protein
VAAQPPAHRHCRGESFFFALLAPLSHAVLCCVVLACSIIVGEVCSRSRWDICYNNVWQMALAFGGCQLLLSQMPNLESAWWSSIIGATMSFLYSTCALGLGAAKGECRGEQSNRGVGWGGTGPETFRSACAQPVGLVL